MFAKSFGNFVSLRDIETSRRVIDAKTGDELEAPSSIKSGSDFNMWIARFAKAEGIPVFYYGPPQMWAWAPWRIRKMRRYVDHVMCNSLGFGGHNVSVCIGQVD